MELDIVVLYLIVVFLLLWLSIKVITSSEYFTVGTYDQYKNMVKLKQCIDQMKHRLSEIKAKKAEYKPGTWHYNYWTKQEREHMDKLMFCRNRLYALDAQLTEGLPYNSRKHHYMFIQGMDSGGNDIKNMAELKNKVNALKAECDALSNCAGFNTNAWLKHTIKPSNQWRRWTNDPAKGMYVKVGDGSMRHIVSRAN